MCILLCANRSQSFQIALVVIEDFNKQTYVSKNGKFKIANE